MLGTVTTVAGRPEDAGLVDGVGNQAEFNQPYGIALQGGMLYVADTYTRAIRQVDPSRPGHHHRGRRRHLRDQDGTGDVHDGRGQRRHVLRCERHPRLWPGLLVTDDSALRYVNTSGVRDHLGGSAGVQRHARHRGRCGAVPDALFGVPQGIASIGEKVFTNSKLDAYVLESDPGTDE